VSPSVDLQRLYGGLARLVHRYAVGYRPIPTLHALELSIVGYWFEQVTDDELNGNPYLDGHRSKVFAVGPQVRCQFAKGGATLKWLHETSAENRPQGSESKCNLRFRFEVLPRLPR
jgi:hypothetical protein